jgi:hypothetical protein
VIVFSYQAAIRAPFGAGAQKPSITLLPFGF